MKDPLMRGTLGRYQSCIWMIAEKKSVRIKNKTGPLDEQAEKFNKKEGI